MVAVPMAKQYYVRSCCSFAMCATILLYGIAVALALALSSDSSLMDEYSHTYMDPSMTFPQQMVVRAILGDNPVVLSTLPLSSSVTAPSLKTTYTQDSILIELGLYDSQGVGLTQLDIQLEVDYILKGVVNLKMKGLLEYSLRQPGGIRHAFIHSQVGLRQHWPIPSQKQVRDKYYISPLLDPHDYLLRDESLYSVYSSVLTPGKTKGPILVELEIEVPRLQKVLYLAKSTERLTQSYLRLVSLLVPLLGLVRLALLALFRHNLIRVQFRVSNNLDKSVLY